jgi:hypothetical protein
VQGPFGCSNENLESWSEAEKIVMRSGTIGDVKQGFISPLHCLFFRLRKFEHTHHIDTVAIAPEMLHSILNVASVW